MNYRYKIEIELDDEKIISDNIYVLESIYENIRKMFADEGINEIVDNSHTLTFTSDGKEKNDWGKMWANLTMLFEEKWFRLYAIKMLWFDNEYGVVNREDVLKGWLEDNWL